MALSAEQKQQLLADRRWMLGHLGAQQEERRRIQQRMREINMRARPLACRLGASLHTARHCSW
jgi:hypothetical protein